MSFKGVCLEHGAYRFRGGPDKGCPFCRLRDEWREVGEELVKVGEEFKKAAADFVRAVRGIKWL